MIKRIGMGLAACMLAVVGMAVVATPANASSIYIGNDGWVGGDCYWSSTAYGCLYWDRQSHEAIWMTATNVADLAGKTFLSGTGLGSGQAVKNNSASIMCTDLVSSSCRSWYNENYSGNYDWLYWGQVGTFYYTLNDNASIQFV